jgi:protein-S-isoprenylcysteine O-methyltransferase Ste14
MKSQPAALTPRQNHPSPPGRLTVDREIVFRTLFALAFVAMMAIRLTYQSRVVRDKRAVEIREGGFSLVAGSVAALTSLVFGAEYLLRPGLFSFAYLLPYPPWLRWLGALLLAGGITLLGLAHHHLGRSFHSLVVAKEDQVLVETGPYRWIRHPIYTAYLMNYLGGGLLAGNLILTVVPVTAYAILVAVRLRREERVLRETFGQAYVAYAERTGRLLPRVGRRG